MTVVAAMLLVLSPWALRNYSLSREFVPVTSMGGLSYFIGNKVVEYYSVRANTAGTAPDREAEQMYSEMRNIVASENPNLSQPQVEAQVDKAFRKMALQHIMAHPLMFIEKILKGAVLVWFQMDTGIKSTGLLLMQAPLLFLALTGIFYALKTKMPVLPLLTVLIYFVLIQTSLSSYGRYSYATIAVLIAFAAYGLDLVLLGTWRHRYTTKRGVENRNLSAGPTVAFRRAIPSSRSLTDCRLLPTFLCRK